MKFLYIIQIEMKLFEVSKTENGVWSYPQLKEDVPLGPNLNGSIAIWPELS